MAHNRNKTIRPKPGATPDFGHERQLETAGHRWIAGIDEAGRGAWAGPVVAAAVIFPPTPECLACLSGVDDSKKLSPNQRSTYRETIMSLCTCCATGIASSNEIDEFGIVAATRLAMQRAINSLEILPDALVIDAVKLPEVSITQDVFYFADSISLSVAAASIIAKTERDKLMCDIAMTTPGYAFCKHKGYGTKLHQRALAELGISVHHRKSFAPVRRILIATNKNL